MSVLLGDLEPAVEAIFSTRHERIVAAEIVFLLTKDDPNTYSGRRGRGGGGKRNGTPPRGGGGGVLPPGRSAARGVASSVLLSAEQRVPMLFVLSTPLDVASATDPGGVRRYQDPVSDGGGGRGGAGTGGSSRLSSTADGVSTSASAPSGQGGSGAVHAGGEGVASPNHMLQLRLDRRGMLVTFEMRGHAHLKLRHCFSLQRLRGTSTESAAAERGRPLLGPGREGSGPPKEAGKDGGGLHPSSSSSSSLPGREGDRFSSSHALVPLRRPGGAEEGVELTLDFGTGGTFTVQFESHIQREMMRAAIHRLQGYSHLHSSSSSSSSSTTTTTTTTTIHHHRFPSSSTSFPSLTSGVAWNGADHRQRGIRGWSGVGGMSPSSIGRDDAEGHSGSASGRASGENMRFGGRPDMVFTPEEEGIVMAYCNNDAVHGAGGSGGGGESGKGFDDTPQIEQALLHDQKVMELELVQTLVQSSSLFSVAKGQVRRLMRDVELLEQRISLHSAHLLTKRQVIQHIERENNMLQRRKRNLEVLQESVLELQRILQLPPEMEECLKKLQNLGGGPDDEVALAAFFKDDRNVQNLSNGMCQMQAVIQDPELPVRFPIPALAERRGYFLNLRRLIVFRSKEYLFTLIDEYESAFFQAMKEQKKRRKKQKHRQKQQQPPPHEKGEKERTKGDDMAAGRSFPTSASFPLSSSAEPEESPRVWVVWSEHDGLHRKLLQMNAIIQALGRIDMEGFMALLRRYRLAMSRMYGAEMKLLFTSLLSQLRTCTKKKKRMSSSSSLKSLFSLSKPPRFLLGSSHASFPYLTGFRAETLAAGDVLPSRGTLPLPCAKEILLQIPPRYRPSSSFLPGDAMEGPTVPFSSFSPWMGGGVGSPSVPSLRPPLPWEGSGGGGSAAPSPRASMASTAVPPTAETARLTIPSVPMKDRLGVACPALIGAARLTRALSSPSLDPYGERSLCGSPSWAAGPPPVWEGHSNGWWASPTWWYTAGLQVFQEGPLFADPLTLAGVPAHRVGGMRGLHVGMQAASSRAGSGKGRVLGCGGGGWSCGSGGGGADATDGDRRGTGREEEEKGMLASGRLPRRLHGGGGALRPDVAMGWLLDCLLSSILVEELVLSECFGVAEGWTWPAAEAEEEEDEEEEEEEEVAWGTKGFGGEEAPPQGGATGPKERRKRGTLRPTTTTTTTAHPSRTRDGDGVDTAVGSHLPFPPPHHQYYHSTLPQWLASCSRGRGPPPQWGGASSSSSFGGHAEKDGKHEMERSGLEAPIGSAYGRGGDPTATGTSASPAGVSHAIPFFSPFTLMAMEGLRGGRGMTRARRAYEQHHAQLLHECLAEMFFGEPNGALHYVLKRIGARVLSFGQTVAKTPGDAVRRAQRRRRRGGGRDGLGAVPASSSSFSFLDGEEEAEEEEEEEEWEAVGEGEEACQGVVVPRTHTKGFGRMQRILRHHFLMQMVSGFTRFVGTHCDKMYAVPILSMVQSLQKPPTPSSSSSCSPTLLPSHSSSLPPPRPPLTQSTFCMVLLREVETVMAGAMMEHIQEQVASIEKGKRQHYLRPTPLFCGWEKFPLYVYRMDALMNGLYVPASLRRRATTATSLPPSSSFPAAASSPFGRREEERSGSLFQGYVDKNGFAAPTFGATSGPLSARGHRGSASGGERPPLRIWVEEAEREPHDSTVDAVQAAKEREEEEEEEEASADFYSQYTSILHRFLDQLFLAVDDITGVSVPAMGMTWSGPEAVAAFLPSSAEEGGTSFSPNGTVEGKGATHFSSPTTSSTSSQLWSEEEREGGGEASTSASPPSPLCGGGPFQTSRTTKGAFGDRKKKGVKKDPSSGSKGKFHFPFFSSSSSTKKTTAHPRPPHDPHRQVVRGTVSSGSMSLPPPPRPPAASSSYTAGEAHFSASPLPPPHLVRPASSATSHPKGYAFRQALNYVHHGASHSGRASGSWWSSWGRWKDRLTRPGRRRREAAASARLRSTLLGSSSTAASGFPSGGTLGAFTEGKVNGAGAAPSLLPRGGGGGELPSTREGLVAVSTLFGALGGGGRGGEGGVSSEVKWRSIHQYRHHAYFCTFYSTLSPLSPTRKCLRRWFDISCSKRDHYERIYLERVLLLQELPIFGTFTTAVQELLEVYSESELRHHRAVSVEVVRGTVAAMEAEIPKGVPQCAERMRQHFLRDVPLESPSLQFHKTLLQRTWQHFCRLVEARFDFMENLLKLEVYVAQGIVLRMTKSELVLNVLNKV